VYAPGIVIRQGFAPPAVVPSIRSNIIGLDPSGLLARPNTFEGIVLETAADVGVGGDGNLIAGNGYEPTAAGTGILILPGAHGSIVESNTIGLNAAGAVMGNGYSGITVIGTGSITDTTTRIGGNTPGQRNVISGNPFAGIAIYTVGAIGAPKYIAIQGNFIGTTAAGAVDGVGNGSFGISVSSGDTIQIGGDAAEANLIAGNGTAGVGAGVHVDGPATQADIGVNAIHSNNGLGIDLGALGVRANDGLGDPDPGPNGLQNYPVLTAEGDGASGTLEIALATAPGVYRINVYTNVSCDASGHGEGAQSLLHTFVTTNVDGLASTSLAVPLTPGQVLTATATDALGNTSEFSACATVADPTVVIGPVGGSGGGPFTIGCPAGRLVTALKGRASSDVNRLEVWCAPAADLTQPATLAGFWEGSGGTDFGTTLTCASGFAIVGLKGRTAPLVPGTTVIDRLGVTCRNPLTGAVSGTADVGTTAPAGSVPFNFNCPVDKLVSGIFGRADAFILHQIGASCQ
jgi:hypothetical protein